MKKLFISLSVIFSTMIFSQVIIGNATGSAANKTSVLLEFPEGQSKGIILPYTRSLPSSPTEGTLLLDASANTAARIKYYNGSWIDLSGQDADISSALSNQPTSAQVSEESNAKVIIGSNSSSANGVLVLESQTKAMLLPAAETTDEIPNPSPGMIVFIRKNGAKRLAVFNGSKWSYWMADIYINYLSLKKHLTSFKFITQTLKNRERISILFSVYFFFWLPRISMA